MVDTPFAGKAKFDVVGIVRVSLDETRVSFMEFGQATSRWLQGLEHQWGRQGDIDVANPLDVLACKKSNVWRVGVGQALAKGW